MDRLLILEDGTIFKGKGFGSLIDTIGEVVFTTGMTGYQETITDPSYNGQILVFANPLVGNTGINRDDYESIESICKAVIVKEFARVPANWRSQMNLDEFLKIKKIPGISGIDTRRLTRHIRESGIMRGMLIDAQDDLVHAFDQLRATVLPSNQVSQVSASRSYASPGVGRNIIVIDFGLKHSLLKELNKRNCHVVVLPYDTTGETILNLAPDGVMLSNGPGDPNDLPQALKMVQELQGTVPIFGIGLGHQLIALANGAKISKLKVGHHGFNYAVREEATGRVDFTSQNHRFALEKETLDVDQWIITHTEIKDSAIAGIKHRYQPVFSTLFQPNATPGPHDAVHLFDQFMEMIDGWKEAREHDQQGES
ncbi:MULTISPECIES: carbamoyl phosphate synthase small subunit [Carnobacterium]|uniref:Carbamoyl phosphate synthase small chain n=2 Tax=Carnobacterium TaxID=2747 RepID=A0ABW4NRK3_9LACT|nr:MULTISPECIES: carbamoyl phosphate synthase small subunit [unclassified Carnobacterium]ALV21230.1 Carbamoyl-phosphate synthase small chain [Carnobacterium sp. CP1]QQP69256.1 carbamoyl phosphate synthase small subunit [Carnobacterium sp. CS13]